MQNEKIKKVTGIFLIISSLCMILIWAILYLSGSINDYFVEFQFKTVFLLISEMITCVLMFCAGIMSLRKNGMNNSLSMFSLGMLLYALLIGIGQFADRKVYLLTFLFSAVAIATIVIGILNLKPNNENKK
jgi:cytochrome bd-type quinol oxidase subunit 2